jgi:hypothetical protein
VASIIAPVPLLAAVPDTRSTGETVSTDAEAYRALCARVTVSLKPREGLRLEPCPGAAAARASLRANHSLVLAWKVDVRFATMVRRAFVDNEAAFNEVLAAAGRKEETPKFADVLERMIRTNKLRGALADVHLEARFRAR